MPRFAFVARNKQGTPEKGAVEAPNLEEAVTILQSRDLLVISLEEAVSKPASIGGKQRGHRGVKPADLIVFARSLSAMSEAGLPLLRSLEIVGEQTRSQRLQAAILDMAHRIRGGSTFRDAIARHPTIFSNFWVSLIETGEASGQLTKGLEQIGTHLEKTGAVKRKVVSALIYPAILMAGAVLAVLIFMLKIIPTFASLYQSFGTELPFLTRMVLSLSSSISHYFLLFLGVAVGLWFCFKFYTGTPAGRWQFDMLKLRMPIIGPLLQAAAAETFAENLSTLLKAGVPILHALEISIATCDNKVIASLLEHMRAGVREGKSLADPLSQSDIFPSMVAQMISVGEQTGKLAAMLEEIAHYYEEQVATAGERLTALLEPVMLVGIAVVIGTLVVSMYLPIFQLSQAIKG